MKPDPLELPVLKLEFICEAEAPVAFWPWDRRADPFEVRLARALGGAPPGPVFFRVPDDRDSCPMVEFDLEVTLWGRRAIAAREEVRAAIHRLGEELHDPVAFTLKDREPFPARSLREIADDLPRMARQLTLTIETPLDVDGDLTRLERGEPPFDFAELVADSARRLALYDLADRAERPDVDPVRHAREAARLARAATSRLEEGFYSWESAWREPEDPDDYESEGESIGWFGHCEFECPSPEAWPWLLALALGRGGRRREEGFGAFSFWVKAGP